MQVPSAPDAALAPFKSCPGLTSCHQPNRSMAAVRLARYSRSANFVGLAIPGVVLPKGTILDHRFPDRRSLFYCDLLSIGKDATTCSTPQHRLPLDLGVLYELLHGLGHVTASVVLGDLLEGGIEGCLCLRILQLDCG